LQNNNNNGDEHDPNSTKVTKLSSNLIRWRKSIKKRTIVAKWWSAIPRSRKNIVYHVKNTQDKRVAYKVHDAIYNNYGTLGSIYL